MEQNMASNLQVQPLQPQTISGVTTATSQPLKVAQPVTPQISSVGTAMEQKPYTPSDLTPENRTKLNNVVHQMTIAGEPEEAIKTAVGQFKQKYANQVSEIQQPEQPKQGRGFLQNLIGPELTGAVSGARSVQATPNIFKSLYDVAKQTIQDPASIREAILHPNTNLLRTDAIGKANETLQKPIGNVKPLAALNNKEAIGLGVQAAGQGLMIGTGGTFTPFASQQFGSSLQDDKSVLRSAIEGIGAGLGAKTLQVASPYLGKMAGGAYDAFVPQAAKDVVEPLVSKAGSFISQNLKTAGEAVNPILDRAVPNAVSDKTLTQIAKERLTKPAISTLQSTYEDLFGATKTGTKVLNKSYAGGKDPAGFLAKNGYVVDVQNGTVNSQPVIQKLREDSQPYNQIMKDILKAKDRVLPTSERIALDDLGTQVKQMSVTTRNKASGNLPQILADIDEKITNLKSTYGDTIGLENLQDIKQASWEGSKAFNPNKPFAKDMEYAFGKASQKLIEDKVPEAAIHNLNSLTGDYADAAFNLSKVDGNKVKGGRLGRYFARTLGGLVGSGVGPIGTLAGAGAGDYIAEMMQNNAIASPLKRMILQAIPEESALYAEAQQALRQLQYGQPLLNAPKPGQAKFENAVPIEMPSKIHPLENTDNSINSKIIRPKYTPSGGKITQIFDEPSNSRSLPLISKRNPELNVGMDEFNRLVGKTEAADLTFHGNSPDPENMVKINNYQNPYPKLIKQPFSANDLFKKAESKLTEEEKNQVYQALFNKNDYSTGSLKLAKAFNESKGQTVLGNYKNQRFELGSFGENNALKKSSLADRFSADELPDTIQNIKNVYKSSNSPKSYRFDNNAYVATMPDGEIRVIYTRTNKDGAQEIVNWHKVDVQKNPKYISTLESFGSPTGN